MKRRSALIAIVSALGCALLLALAGTQPRVVRASELFALTQTAEPPTSTPTNTPPPPATPTATQVPVPYPPPSTAVPATPVPPPPSGESTGVADVSLRKSVSPSEARVGDEIVYTITVRNAGPDNALGVVVIDSVPDSVDISSGTSTIGGVSAAGRTITITIGTLRPDEEVVITLRGRLNSRAVPPGVRNVAVVNSSNDSTPNNNTDTAEIAIPGTPTPTETPLVGPTPTPTASPAPIAQPPSQLPRTGDAELPLAVAGIALVMLAIGVGTRRRR
jgi:uncharacterized repeat protein (TIGR01451 family)/LPXTG-motif cell wall-anchored protein